MIHLDTSVLIRALVAGSPDDRRLRGWLETGEPLAMSAPAWTEFLCEPVEARHVELARLVVPERIPYTEDDALLAAQLFNESGRRDGSLVDCMIAAVAIRHGASLATANRADFTRFAPARLSLLDD